MLLLHYTGVASAAKAIDWLSRPESKVSRALRHRRGGRHHAAGGGGACAPGTRASPCGPARPTSTRPPSASRSRTPATSSAIPDFPEPQLRAARGAVPGHHRAARHPARARARPFRRRAHAQEGSRREVSLGAAGARPASATGWRPEPVNWADPGIARDAAGPLVAAVQTLLAGYGYGIEATGGFDPQDRVRGHGLPAPLPARARRRPHRPVDHHHARAAERGAAAPRARRSHDG